MGKLIDEQTAYDVLTAYYHHTTDIQHEALREALGRVETVDAIPVVRCRDCRYSQRINEWVYHCYMWNDDKMFNQYCDMGERKDGDHETD